MTQVKFHNKLTSTAIILQGMDPQATQLATLRMQGQAKYVKGYVSHPRPSAPVAIQVLHPNEQMS